MSRQSKTEEFRPSNAHWNFKTGLFKERVTKPQLRHLLLNHSDPIIRSHVCKWKHKHLGAGVYELWAERPGKEVPMV